MYKIVIALTFIIWSLVHVYMMKLNQILTNADGFAYLQMAYKIRNLDLDWLWTGWFWFLYSFVIAFFDYFVNLFWINTSDSLFLSAQISNIVLLIISWVLLFNIWKKYLSDSYNALLLILFFLSASLINYNINILSENLYIALFLWLFIILEKFITEIAIKRQVIKIKWQNIELNNKYEIVIYTLLVSFFMSLLYYTRGEAFIYLWAIALIVFFLFAIKRETSFLKWSSVIILLILGFFIFAFPYIYYLHTITWEWWLTNKWSSNIRQANLRWIEEMDNDWFEIAVWELTPDKHRLVWWFAWWLMYDKPSENIDIIDYLKENKKEVFTRFLENQKKLYLEIIPKLLIWNSLAEYKNPNFIFYNSKIFIFFLVFPLVLVLFWAYKLLTDNLVRLTEKRNLMLISISLFVCASLFFSLFFILERYFIVFLPIILIVMIYWAHEMSVSKLWEDSTIKYVIKYMSIATILIFVFLLWITNYYTYNRFNDYKYEMKKEAWIWIKDNIKDIDTSYSSWSTQKNNLRIMERFPITTYYANSIERRLTPHVDNLEDLLEYARFNDIDLLIVDTMDFQEYREKLSFLLDNYTDHKWLEMLHIVQIPWKKVIIYKIVK